MANSQFNILLKPILLGVVLSFLFLHYSCEKTNDPVPNVSFTAYLDKSLPDYSGTVFTVYRDRFGNKIGISGVIVFRLSDVEFYVFERYCPHDKKLNCIVSISDDKSLAECGCCNSQYLILSPTGDVISGPSKWNLKTYRSRVEGNYLVISN